MRLAIDLGAAVLAFDPVGSVGAFPWLVSVGSLRMVARAGQSGDAETATMTCAIDNQGQQAARVLDVPLRRLATVYDDAGDVFFRGTVQRMQVGRLVRLTLETGGAGLLLSEPLPLRTTRELGDFAEDRALPQRYGDLTGARFELVRLSATEYLAADHPMSVDAVFVDDERTLAWEAALGRDDAGHAWQLVRFAAPIGENQAVTATGTGKRNPRTGALIENPADIMSDVLAIAGVAAIFPDLRAQADAEGLRLAGSVTEARTVRDVVDEVARSAGAIWTLDGARLYPSDELGPVFDLDAAQAGGLDDPTMDLEDTADVLRVAYDYSEASERSQHFVELAASPRLFGGRSAEVALPWVRLPANAESIGSRILRRMAGRRVSVAFTAARHDLRPGHAVRLVDSPEWHLPGADPLVTVLAVDVAADAGSSRVVGEALLSSPSVSVLAHSVALPDTTEGGIDVAFRDGVATFTVRDDDGRPLAAARVTLDGGAPRMTNDRGQVAFTARQGAHELLVEIAGFATQRIDFEL